MTCTIDCSQAGAGNSVGVLVRNSSEVTLGTYSDSMYIVGNRSDGLDIRESQHVRATGAHLGTPVFSGQGNGGSGALVTDSTDVLIHASRIGGNTEDGVVVTGSSSKVRVSADYAFTGNGGEAIDLGADGVTANDPGDVDEGPNGLVNSPTILGFESAGRTALVQLNHAPTVGKVRVDVYANSACDASGAGEGEEPAGVAMFELDGSSSLVRVPLEFLVPNWAYSATATVAGQGTVRVLPLPVAGRRARSGDQRSGGGPGDHRPHLRPR